MVDMLPPKSLNPEMETSLKEVVDKNFSQHDVVVEVGARFGAATKYLASKVDFVYTFEPNPYSFKYMMKVLNGISNVQAYNIAISNKDGESRLNLTHNSFSIAASLYKLKEAQDIYIRSVPVQTRTLDGFVFQRKPTILLIDCEGSEYDVLLGGPIFLRHIKMVFIELHDIVGRNLHKGCLRLLTESRFNSTVVAMDNPFKRKKVERWIYARN